MTRPRLPEAICFAAHFATNASLALAPSKRVATESAERRMADAFHLQAPITDPVFAFKDARGRRERLR